MCFPCRGTSWRRGRVLLFKFMKPKQNVKGDTDLEDFDFDDYDEDEGDGLSDEEQEDEEA